MRCAFAAVALAIGFLAFACEDTDVPHPCTGVPEHGCPLAHGVACDDPHCEAIYACRPNNVWEFVQNCPNYDASSEIPFDAGPPPIEIIDATTTDPPGGNGGPNCEPLEDPDCPADLALGCTPGQCCGCEDLFVCTNDGWVLWGECDPDGGIRQTPEDAP